MCVREHIFERNTPFYPGVDELGGGVDLISDGHLSQILISLMQGEKQVESAFMATALPSTQNRAAQLESCLRGVIRGNDSVVRMALVAVFARGHLLIEGVPGAGKTTLAQALARALDGEFQRIQFTSDTPPCDVLGLILY